MTRADRKADEIIRQFDISDPPVDLERIAREFNISIKYQPFTSEDESDDISGMLYRKGDQAIIGINSVHSNARKRFSIAHELGHFFLHKEKIFVDAQVNFRNRISTLGVDRREIEANGFAAALLMPKRMLLAHAKKISDQRSSLDELSTELASMFEVSKQAMEYRLKNLGLIGIE